MLTDEHQVKVNLAVSILARISAGDKIAEQQLVTTYYRGLFFILNRQTNNHSLSEDLAQDTFVIVIQKARAGQINNPAALSAFIRQTGVNLLIAHCRKEQRRDTHGVDDIDVHAPSDTMEISQALHNIKTLDLVRQMMIELPTDRDRDILRSYFIYDKNKQQICQEMELTAEHFDRVLFRARQRLKQLISHTLPANTGPSKGVETISNLLSVCLILGVANTIQPYPSHLFVQTVRENHKPLHLTFETPELSSRFISNYPLIVCGSIGKQLTPKSRCA